MFRFKTKQKIFQVGTVKFGGNRGENPVVLIGSIFYKGHKIVEDERKGVFDKEAAEKLINEQDELSDKSGIPAILDVVGLSEEAIRRYIDFIADITDKPFLIDSSNPQTKIAGIKYAKEIGLERKIIYNSVSEVSKDIEFKAIAETNINSAVILAYTRNVVSSRARVEVVEKLLSRAEKIGVTKPLIDTFVIDIPSLGAACKATIEIKNRYGLPCGCGAHNAVATWVGVKKLFGKDGRKASIVAANIMPVIMCSDFVLYGPVEDCKYMFPAVYAIESTYRYSYRFGDFLEI